MIQKCPANKVKQSRSLLLSLHLFLRKHTSSYLGPVTGRPHDLSGGNFLPSGRSVEKTERDKLPFDLKSSVGKKTK